MTLILLIVSLIVNCVGIFVIYNLLKKNELMEGFISNAWEYADNVLQNMRELDHMEMFEKDDEVGSIFEQMKSIVEDYANLFGSGTDES